MPVKVVESTLRFKTDDQATSKIQTMTEEVGKLVEKFATLRDIEIPVFDRFGVRGVRETRKGVRTSGRAPDAPDIVNVKWEDADKRDKRQKDHDKDRDKGKFSSLVSKATRWTGTFAGAGLGLGEMGGMLQQAGYGIMPAFGGVMAPVGAGLALGGLGLLLGRHLAAPSKEWNLRTANLQYFLGEQRIRDLREYGAAWGVGPEETAEYTRRFYRIGAEEAVEPMLRGAFGEVRPEDLAPYMETITRAGGALGRTKTEYTLIAKEVGAQVALASGSANVQEYLDTLVGLTQQGIEITGDMDKTGRHELQALSMWMNTTGSAMLRGARGAETMGKWRGFVTTPGGPGEEMFLYQALANNPEYRKYLAKQGILPEGVAIGPHQFALMRERGIASYYAAKYAAAGMSEEEFALAFGFYGRRTFSQTGAVAFHRAVLGGKDINQALKEAEEADKRSLGPTSATNLGDSVRGLDATMKELQLRLGDKLVIQISQLETGLLNASNKILELTGVTKTTGEVIKSFTTGLENMIDWLKHPKGIAIESANVAIRASKIFLNPGAGLASEYLEFLKKQEKNQ